MAKLLLATLLFFVLNQALAEPPEILVDALKPSVVKVQIYTKSGGRGLGSGVVVSNNLVATNCHVLAGSNGVAVVKMGESYAPVGVRSDWKHDLCLLRFTDLPFPAVVLGDSETLKYEQEIFSLGYSGGAPKPLTTWGKIKALYPMDDSQIVRTSASFRMGASGSPVFDEAGRLVAVNTFKSPGRQSYYYNVPVKWVKQLFDAPETAIIEQGDLPFWDAPEEARPFFMRVVIPLQNEEWAELERIAKLWIEREPNNAEGWYYLGLAQDKQSRSMEA
ncbi:MAG: trypsin-like peptidase domain-containing protein, partial [Methylophilales bacterium]|nr:trypsin-like peptidase domain-containing protein [Methylophilales bacterium]